MAILLQRGYANATFGITISVLIGTLVASIPILAFILTFPWGLASGFASLYGNTGANVGLVVGTSFISTISLPGDLAVALMRSLLCLIAGGWAMLLSLVMRPFKPYNPLRIAVAECFNALANYLQTFAGEAATTENILDVRKALEIARMTLGTARIGQSAQSWMGEQCYCCKSRTYADASGSHRLQYSGFGDRPDCPAIDCDVFGNSPIKIGG